MVGHDEQGGQHGRHADGAEVAADEGHTGITVAGAVHAHEEDGHEEAEVAQGRDQQARHHQGQDGGREQDLLQQPGGQVEDERPDAEHGHDEGDVPVGHQTGRPVGQTAQDVPQGGHGRAVVDENAREEGVVLDGLSELLRRCGLLVGVEEHGELSIRFEHGIFDSREVCHAL